MKEIQNKLHWLTNFIGEIDSLLKDIPNSKIKHFALEAKALDVSELKDFNLPKRYILLLCITYRSKISAIDSLVEMFLKRVRTIHNKGKEELELLREKHRSKTENLISVLAEVLDTPIMLTGIWWVFKFEDENGDCKRDSNGWYFDKYW
jgi:hypothetical protein